MLCSDSSYTATICRHCTVSVKKKQNLQDINVFGSHIASGCSRFAENATIVRPAVGRLCGSAQLANFPCYDQ